jgi:hypothetical protein
MVFVVGLASMLTSIVVKPFSAMPTKATGPEMPDKIPSPITPLSSSTIREHQYRREDAHQTICVLRLGRW